jgi:hypothetical protein
MSFDFLTPSFSGDRRVWAPSMNYYSFYRPFIECQGEALSDSGREVALWLVWDRTSRRSVSDCRMCGFFWTRLSTSVELLLNTISQNGFAIQCETSIVLTMRW